MAVDHAAVIESEAARIVAAYAASQGGKVPWSDRRSVNTVARHVAGAHHVVAQVIEDRPTAHFGRFEGLVRRWDAEAGAGIAGPAMDPAVAADAIDEHVDFAVSATRAIHGSPAGPAVRIACTDADQEWYLDFAEPGRRTLQREPVDVALTLRGGAEALLLWIAPPP